MTEILLDAVIDTLKLVPICLLLIGLWSGWSTKQAQKLRR